MTEEIKEILDNLYRYKDEDYMKYQPEDILTIEDVWLLLDCITNLQQKDFESQKEITKLKDKLEQQRKEYQNTYKDVRIEIKEKNERIANLQQENERLKEENKRIFSKVNDDELLISNAMNYAEAQDYKSRCKKANDFIDNYDVFKEFSFPLMKRDIENQIKSSIDYEFNSTFRKKIKNIINGGNNNE